MTAEPSSQHRWHVFNASEQLDHRCLAVCLCCGVGLQQDYGGGERNPDARCWGSKLKEEDHARA